MEKKKLKKEVNLQSKLNKQLKDDVQHLEHEKSSLQNKIYKFETAVSSPSGRNPRDSVLQKPLWVRPVPSAVKRPKLTDPTEDDSFKSMTVRDWDINLVQLSLQGFVCCFSIFV